MSQCWACLSDHPSDVYCGEPARGRLRRAVLTTVAAVCLLLPLTVSGNAEAAAVNWMRPCSTVASHPLAKRCAVTPTVPGHTLRYRDAAGRLHTLHSPASAWRWLTTHSVRCSLTRKHGDASCYGRDQLTHGRYFAYSTRTAVMLTRLR